MKDVFALVVEYDNFYDTKEFDCYIFENELDAIDYMRDLMQYHKLDLIDRLDLETEEELLSDYLEICRESDTYCNFYVEENCNIEFYIQKKPILKF